MKADPDSEVYYKQEEIVETISCQIESTNLKCITFRNKYDNQPLMFVYDTTQKLCYNIDIAFNKTIHAILVNYDEFVDAKGNFIYD